MPLPEARALLELVLLPLRLVAARIALERFRPPDAAPAVDPLPPVEPPRVVLPPLFTATLWLPPPLKLAPRIPPSRPPPPRVPRICGTINETNFSAPVTPANRNVLSSFPLVAAAVRKATSPPPVVSLLAPCIQYHAPKPTNPSTPTPHSQPRVGRFGSSVGAEGGTSCGCLGSPG